MATATELREMHEEELEGRLVEYRRELLNLRFQLATGQLDNVTRINQVKKNVARVLTILRDRELALLEGREPTTVSVPVRPRRAAEEAVAGDDEADDEPVADDDLLVVDDQADEADQSGAEEEDQ